MVDVLVGSCGLYTKNNHQLNHQKLCGATTAQVTAQTLQTDNRLSLQHQMRQYNDATHYFQPRLRQELASRAVPAS
eukprot:SAG31_NODE_2723_length_5187_cov_7.411164_3_plen_76_part_00